MTVFITEVDVILYLKHWHSRQNAKETQALFEGRQGHRVSCLHTEVDVAATGVAKLKPETKEKPGENEAFRYCS